MTRPTSYTRARARALAALTHDWQPRRNLYPSGAIPRAYDDLLEALVIQERRGARGIVEVRLAPSREGAEG